MLYSHLKVTKKLGKLTNRQFAHFSVFWPVESKSDVHFRLLEPENLSNSETRIFTDYRGFRTRPPEMNTYTILILQAWPT